MNESMNQSINEIHRSFTISRTLYVGVLSSLIILFPALLMTCLFRKRRLRTTPRQSVHPESPRDPYPGPTTHIIRPASRSKSFGDTFSDFPPIPMPTERGEITRQCDTVNDPLRLVYHRDLSPHYGDLSPHHRDLSPHHRDPSPHHRDLSPHHRDLSPHHRDPSPHHRDLSPLSTLQVEPNVLAPPGSAPSPFGNFLFVHSGCSSPDSGYRSPALSGRPRGSGRSCAVLIETEETRLSPVNQEFYNADSEWSNQRTFHINSAPNLTRTFKTYSDSEQAYERLCTEQYNEQKRLQLCAKGAGTHKPRPLPWWAIFIAYAIVFMSIGVSAAFTLFYSLRWGGAVSLEWMVSLFLSTTTGTFLIEPLKVRSFSIINLGNTK